jgi:hypothetical protein
MRPPCWGPRSLAYDLVRRGVFPSLCFGRWLVVPHRRLLAMIEGGQSEVAR